MKNTKVVILLFCIVLILCACNKKGYKAEDYIQLGNYIGIEIEGMQAEVNDEDINEALNELLNEHIEYGDVTRPIEMYDFVNINLSAVIDGEEIGGFTASNYDIYLGFTSYVMDGFAEKLIGLEPDRTHTISMIVPDSYIEEQFIGKEVTFTVTINGVKGQIKPELNDDFIKSVTEHSTINEYIDSIMDSLILKKQKSVNDQLKLEAWKYLVDNTVCTGYPDDLLAGQIAETKEAYELNAAYKGQMVEDYMEDTLGMSLEEFAKGQLKQRMMFEVIAAKEKIKLSDSEYEKNLESFAAGIGYADADAFVEKYGKEKIKQAMLWDKIQSFILEKAVIK